MFFCVINSFASSPVAMHQSPQRHFSASHEEKTKRSIQHTERRMRRYDERKVQRVRSLRPGPIGRGDRPCGLSGSLRDMIATRTRAADSRLRDLLALRLSSLRSLDSAFVSPPAAAAAFPSLVSTLAEAFGRLPSAATITIKGEKHVVSLFYFVVTRFADNVALCGPCVRVTFSFDSILLLAFSVKNHSLFVVFQLGGDFH